MEFVHKGNQLFVEENYERAIEQYTNGLSKLMGQQQFGALFGRARACMHVDKYYNAIRDFGECLSLDHTHQLTNYYLGLCLIKIGKHDIEKMEQAHKYLLIAQKGDSKQDRFEDAVQKCIKILQKLRPKVEISKQAATTTDTTQTTSTKDVDDDQDMKSKPDTNTPSAPAPATAVTASTPKLREIWYQTATNITFTLYVKKLTRDDVSIAYDSKMVTIALRLKDGTTYTRKLSLSGEIDAAKCSHSVNPYKVIVTLSKQSMGDWEVLEEALDDGKSAQSTIRAPWTTKKDWDQVDAYAKEEIEKEKPEGDEALQSLFSKIYGDADEDQRRAMVKSFQTSGGTVLSTNWNDVKEKDYEGKDKVLPTGQDVKKWEY